MAAIIEGLISNPDFDTHLRTYEDHERAHANRVVSAYFKAKLQYPQLKQREICDKIGVSNSTLAKYKHDLGQPVRKSTTSREQKLEALSKGLVTRRRNQEFRAFLSELSERKLSADDTRREIDGWRRAHGLGELSASLTQPVSSTTEGPSAQSRSSSGARKKHGGRLEQGAERAAYGGSLEKQGAERAAYGGALEETIDEYIARRNAEFK